MDSILQSIKVLLGVGIDYHFDNDLILFINSAFFIVWQIGASKEAYKISGSTEKWSDFCSDIEKMELVKSYVFLKVRKMFDPPTSGILMEALNQLTSEAEWRLKVYCEGEKENA